MKVLQINVVCGIRSTGRICTDLAEILESNGHACKIAYGRMDVPEKYRKYAIKIGNKVTLKVDAGLTRLLDNAGLNSYFATKRLIGKIKDYEPDIIHLHNLHGSYIHIRVLFDFLKTYDKPVVWTLHDCWAFTGHCAYFSQAGCQKWQTGCHTCPQKKEYPKSVFLGRARSNFAIKKDMFSELDKLMLITPSAWLAELVDQSFLREYPIKVINNGIDTEKFNICPNESFRNVLPADKKIVIAVASTWDKRKGLEDVVEISRRLDDRYQVVVVGVSESQKAALVNENLIAITRTNNVKQLAELYSAAHVFINTTYEDNYPTVNIEALCCGCPVITYHTGGSIESVDETNGMVVPQGDVAAMVSAIEDVQHKNYSKTDISSCAKEKHLSARMAEKYMAVYESMIDS